MANNLQCPVDNISINENQARVTAYQVMYITVAWLISGWWPIMAFLAIDFFLRTVNLGKFSPLNIISTYIIKKLGIVYKPVDRAPKRFAAFVGLVFSTAILPLSLLHADLPAELLAYTLALFAALEAVLAFCAGCYVYAFFFKFFKRQSQQTFIID
jgi:hypothetical protein